MDYFIYYFCIMFNLIPNNMRTINSVLNEIKKSSNSKFYDTFLEKFPKRETYEKEFVKFFGHEGEDFEDHYSNEKENDFLFRNVGYYNSISYDDFVVFIDELINSEDWT